MPLRQFSDRLKRVQMIFQQRDQSSGESDDCWRSSEWHSDDCQIVSRQKKLSDKKGCVCVFSLVRLALHNACFPKKNVCCPDVQQKGNAAWQ